MKKLILFILILSSFALAQEVVNGNRLQVSGTGVATQMPNDGSTGTTIHKLAKLTGTGTAVITATTDTAGAVGVVISGAGTTGNANIVRDGQALLAFDGATTANDYVQISSSVTGDGTDAGATCPSSGQVIGRVLSSNGSSGTYNILVGLSGCGGGGGGSGTVTATGYVSGTPPAAFSTATNITPATFANMVALFSSCSGTQYLGYDGNCHTGGSAASVGSQFAVQYSSDGAGNFAGTTPPTSPNGVVNVICNIPSGSAATAPTNCLPGLVARSVSGTTSTDTIVSTDCNPTYLEYETSVAVGITLPTPVTLAVANCTLVGINATTGTNTALTITPTTWTINGSSTATVAQGQTFRIINDPDSTTNWLLFVAEQKLTAGTNVTFTRSATGISIAASGGGGSGTVTSVGTSSPLGGGTITTTGTITCTTCTTNASALTSNLPVIGAGSNTVAVGTVSGNTTEFGTVSGSLTSGNLIKSDASGNLVDAGVQGASVLSFGDNVSTGSQFYYPISGVPNGSQGNALSPVARAGTVSALYCESSVSLTGTMTYTFTMYKAAAGSTSGSAQSLTCTINSTNANNCSDTTSGHNFTVIASDLLLMDKTIANTPTAGFIRCSVLLQ